MTTPYLGEIRLIAFNFAPRGWALCNGQSIQISQNPALFSLFGTTYGGDGVTTFLLPNMQSRVALHVGNGFTQGQVAGESNHTLTLAEIPSHVHAAQATLAPGTELIAAGDLLGAGAAATYLAPDANLVAMGATALATAGSSQPHLNEQPYLVVNFVVALQGIFPSQS